MTSGLGSEWGAVPGARAEAMPSAQNALRRDKQVATALTGPAKASRTASARTETRWRGVELRKQRRDQIDQHAGEAADDRAVDADELQIAADRQLDAARSELRIPCRNRRGDE